MASARPQQVRTGNRTAAQARKGHATNVACAPALALPALEPQAGDPVVQPPSQPPVCLGTQEVEWPASIQCCGMWPCD